MTVQAHEQSSARVGPLPLLAWLLIQLAALGLAAGRVPLAARFPAAAETFALDEMLVSQVVFAAMLSPVLLKDLASSFASILTSLPFISLSGYLAAATVGGEIRSAIVVAAWLVTLYAWQRVFRSHQSKMIFVAIANLLTLGLPLIWLVRADATGTTPTPDHARIVLTFSPTIAALNGARGPTVFPFYLFAVAASGVALIVYAARARSSAARQLIHRKLSTM
jgi:hypothetical protein